MSFAKVHDLHKGHVHYNMYTIDNSLSKVARATFDTCLQLVWSSQLFIKKSQVRNQGY